MRALDRLPELGERIMVRRENGDETAPWFPARVITCYEAEQLNPKLSGKPGTPPTFAPVPLNKPYGPDDTIRAFVCDDGWASFCIMYFPSYTPGKAEYNRNIRFP